MAQLYFKYGAMGSSKTGVLFDLPEVHCACLPITFTRAVSDVRVGILYDCYRSCNI